LDPFLNEAARELIQRRIASFESKSNYLRSDMSAENLRQLVALKDTMRAELQRELFPSGP
jgi:hypothetical protein